jgi:hypothetical protein
MYHSRKLAVCIVLVMWILAACGGLSSEGRKATTAEALQKQAANEALKALRKIEAATQVGVKFEQYQEFVTEAKAQMNEASARLPEGDLKRELTTTMDAYFDAGQVWGKKVEGFDRLYPNSDLGNMLEAKYSLPEDMANDAAMQALWGIAGTHLQRASSLLQE